MGLSGKGFFIWKVPSAENGNPTYITNQAVANKFTHVLIKIADGIALSNYDTLKNIDYVAPVAAACGPKEFRFGDGITFMAMTLSEKPDWLHNVLRL